ncbi:hypothetical protein ACK280_16140 [Mycobacterium sherrisii]|uniref:hypothetical protein n=1 Tax=Mycobacterium sherrisii TaxID=243061 RepID=UPI003976582D
MKFEADRPDAGGILEEAEAEAAAAEAFAAAARARVRAIRLHRQAEATEAASPKAVSATAAGQAALPPAEETELVSTATATAVADREPTDAADVPADHGGRPPGAKKTARRFHRPRTTTVVGGIGVLCTAALIAVSALMAHHHENLLDKQQRAAEFTAAARQVVVTLMSINAANAKDDVQHIMDSSTGPFRDEFRGAAEDFVKVAQSAKVSTKTNVQAACLESMTDDTAVVLVAANSTLTNTAGTSEQPRSWRLSVKLARDGGKIKMSSMEFIP